MNDEIQKTELNMHLTDAYWALVNMSGDHAVDPQVVLVLIQYMLTAYLSTIPSIQGIEVEVLELLRKILPERPLPRK